MKKWKGFRRKVNQEQGKMMAVPAALCGAAAGMLAAVLWMCAISAMTLAGWVQEGWFGILVPVGQAGSILIAMAVAARLSREKAALTAGLAGILLWGMSLAIGLCMGGGAITPAGWVFAAMVPICAGGKRLLAR